jgi:hypothetical protein
MSTMTHALAILVSVAAGPGGSAPNSGSAEDSFKAFIPRFEMALTRFVNGDATLWKRYASGRAAATIMGGWGGYERGGQVAARYDWAASQFVESGATVQVEYLSASVSGTLAYTVTIERSTVRPAGKDGPMPMALRATHVFEMENGEWKLVHRHADNAMERVGPGEVSTSRGR